MKTKLLKSIVSFVLALAVFVGSGFGMGASRECRPQCDDDYTYYAD